MRVFAYGHRKLSVMRIVTGVRIKRVIFRENI